jgi:hypothetical protein
LTSGRIPLLDIDAPYEPPLDIISAFTTRENLFDNRSDLTPITERAHGCFLGLRVATRVFSSSYPDRPMPADRIIRSDSRDAIGRNVVRVAPFVNAGMAHVSDHLSALPRSGPFVLDRQLPDARSTSEALAAKLLGAPVAGSVHIAAHCINRAPPAVTGQPPRIPGPEVHAAAIRTGGDARAADVDGQ